MKLTTRDKIGVLSILHDASIYALDRSRQQLIDRIRHGQGVNDIPRHGFVAFPDWHASVWAFNILHFRFRRFVRKFQRDSNHRGKNKMNRTSSKPFPAHVILCRSACGVLSCILHAGQPGPHRGYCANPAHSFHEITWPRDPRERSFKPCRLQTISSKPPTVGDPTLAAT
jgi:hypothetical protein